MRVGTCAVVRTLGVRKVMRMGPVHVRRSTALACFCLCIIAAQWGCSREQPTRGAAADAPVSAEAPAPASSPSDVAPAVSRETAGSERAPVTAPNAYDLEVTCGSPRGGTGVAYKAVLRTAPGHRAATLSVDGYQTMRRLNLQMRPAKEGDDEAVDVVFESYAEADVHHSVDFAKGDVLLRLVHAMREPSGHGGLVEQARVVTRWQKLRPPCDMMSANRQQFACDGFVLQSPPACVTVCSTAVEDAGCPSGMTCTGAGMSSGKLIQYCEPAAR